MKIDLPREPARGNNGYYGGVGSKPAPRSWRPPTHERTPAPDVTRRLIPRLQLRRRRRARPDDHAQRLPVPIAVAMVVVALYLLSILVGCGGDAAPKETPAQAADGFVITVTRPENAEAHAAGTVQVIAETGARRLTVPVPFTAQDDAAAILARTRAALAEAGWTVEEATTNGVVVRAGPGGVRLTAFSVAPKYTSDPAIARDDWNLGPPPTPRGD